MSEFVDKRVKGYPIEKGVYITARAGVLFTNVPHLVVSHSPDGFNVGYAGSGPADLALNICEWYCRKFGNEPSTEKLYSGKCTMMAWRLHQQFKEEFLVSIKIPSFFTINRLNVWFYSHAKSVFSQKLGVDLTCEKP